MVTTEDSDFTVAKLPVYPERQYPQSNFVNLKNITYKITYSFIGYDSSLVMEILRTADNRIMWRGKVPLKNRWKVKDPVTGEDTLGFYSKDITPENLTIFVWVK